jgi:hypothetical protein
MSIKKIKEKILKANVGMAKCPLHVPYAYQFYIPAKNGGRYERPTSQQGEISKRIPEAL